MAAKDIYAHVTREVDNSEAGSHIAAFFDLDRTLLTGFSANAFMKGRIKSGEMSRQELLASVAAFVNYMLGDREFSNMVATSTKALKDIPEHSFDELSEEIYEKHLASSVYPEARELVKAHQRKGHTLVIVSSATPYQIKPLARELGIKHVLCTRFEVKDGLFTGNVLRPTCWGQGKAHYASLLAEQEALEFDKSYFYTDSMEDLPLLELVGKPRPLNPDHKLAAHAADHNWPVQHFSQNAKPDYKQVLRNGLVYVGLVPSALVAMPVKLLTGSNRKAANAAVSTWVELACAAIGVEVRVKGKEHVWSHRPAVFIYNHQTSADTMVVPKVLERDYVGVAKKEVGEAPIFGKFAKAIGTVFIDRTDSTQLKEELKPALEALQDGISLVIAPEGTRSNSEKLGPFKKGAFHIAMQAGVPIVPFVVHNAIDIAPKGAKVYRSATVDVDVLPPIVTDDWKVEDLDRHVAEVRDLFLECLGQKESSEKKARTSRKAAPKVAIKQQPKSNRRTAKKRPAAKTPRKSSGKAD